MFLLNKVLFIFADKLGNIVKIFNIILSIPFKDITSLTNKVLDCMVFTFFDTLFVEQTVYLKRFKDVNIAVNKNG